jgi:hypothetical protein
VQAAGWRKAAKKLSKPEAVAPLQQHGLATEGTLLALVERLVENGATVFQQEGGEDGGQGDAGSTDGQQGDQSSGQTEQGARPSNTSLASAFNGAATGTAPKAPAVAHPSQPAVGSTVTPKFKIVKGKKGSANDAISECNTLDWWGFGSSCRPLNIVDPSKALGAEC